MRHKDSHLAGWGNRPQIQARLHKPRSFSELTDSVETLASALPIGNLRSYGDSALFEEVVDLKGNNLMLGFDQTTGVLEVQAGCLLMDILSVFVPRGWFVAVSPGTRLITVGGAIASDVHGKNHHQAGCFSDCVESLQLLLPDGSTKECSHSQEAELFHATCGGQGLTGIVLSARIRLQRIGSSRLRQTTFKTSNLQETFQIFEEQADADYSVAWIDCLKSGDELGRAHVSIGEFGTDENYDYAPSHALSLPIFLPGFVLNGLSMKVFNQLYYHRQRAPEKTADINLDSFFYPLDSVGNWNRAYGKQGFVQYQFVLPLENSYSGMQSILSKIALSGRASFLAVLKLHGPENANWLSFPLEGYSLALDFKWHSSLPALLDALDQEVVKFGGRIYLAKDSRVPKSVFEKGYPDIDRFRELRKDYGMDKKFNSLQSLRLHL